MSNHHRRDARQFRIGEEMKRDREPVHSTERYCECGARARWHVSGGKRAGFYCDAHRPEL
jgi:hypothetical protein